MGMPGADELATCRLHFFVACDIHEMSALDRGRACPLPSPLPSSSSSSHPSSLPSPLALVLSLLSLLSLVSVAWAQSAGVCDPVDPSACLLPLPSTYYLRPDPSAPSGMRLVYPPGALPVDRRGATTDPSAWSRLDGAPVSTAAVAYFANLSVDASGLPGWQRYARSLDDDCPTVLLDTVTGQRLPHFAELDMSAPVGPEAERRAASARACEQKRAGTRANCLGFA